VKLLLEHHAPDTNSQALGGNMADVNVKWTGGLQFLATDELGHTVVTDRDGQGFKPPILLLASLVTCSGIDVVRILEKKRKKIASIEAKVTKENEPDPPWFIKKIEVEWVIRGPNMTQKAAEDAVQLAEHKYCSVYASLESEIVSTVRIENEE
jgi:putative redox protein